MRSRPGAQHQSAECSIASCVVLLPWSRRRRGLSRKELQASGSRAHGRKYADCLHGCRFAESLVDCWRVPNAPFDQQVAHVTYDSTLSSTPACDSTLSSKIFVGMMRMDVSSIQAPLHMRGATERGEDSTLSIHRNQSSGGGQKPRRRSAEREGSHSSNDGNPLVDGRLTVRRMRRVVGTC
jgi:hypothetical protein